MEDRNNRINKVKEKEKEKERPRFRTAITHNQARPEQRTIPWNFPRGATSSEKVVTHVPNATFGFKKLTQVEIQSKKEKGLCFQCDGK